MLIVLPSMCGLTVVRAMAYWRLTDGREVYLGTLMLPIGVWGQLLQDHCSRATDSEGWTAGTVFFGQDQFIDEALGKLFKRTDSMVELELDGVGDGSNAPTELSQRLNAQRIALGRIERVVDGVAGDWERMAGLIEAIGSGIKQGQLTFDFLQKAIPLLAVLSRKGVELNSFFGEALTRFNQSEESKD